MTPQLVRCLIIVADGRPPGRSIVQQELSFRIEGEVEVDAADIGGTSISL